MPRKYTRVPLPVRFWLKVDRSGGPTACWPWVAIAMNKGYGLFHVNGRNQYAHRVAWELTYGPIPDDEDDNPLWVLHDCPGGDNPACCNPAHLFLGTAADNTRDMMRKGRHATGARHGRALHPERYAAGAAHPNSRITESLVRAIRARAAAGEPILRIARDLGISRTAIRLAVARETWKHVP
jgi:hypothetical protein